MTSTNFCMFFQHKRYKDIHNASASYTVKNQTFTSIFRTVVHLLHITKNQYETCKLHKISLIRSNAHI